MRHPADTPAMTDFRALNDDSLGEFNSPFVVACDFDTHVPVELRHVLEPAYRDLEAFEQRPIRRGRPRNDAAPFQWDRRKRKSGAAAKVFT